jgi:hypothetical protein
MPLEGAAGRAIWAGMGTSNGGRHEGRIYIINWHIFGLIYMGIMTMGYLWGINGGFLCP